MYIEKSIQTDLIQYINEFQPMASELDQINLYQQLQALYGKEYKRYNASLIWLRNTTRSDWDTVLYINGNPVFQRQMAANEALVKEEGMKRQSDPIENEQITKKSRTSHSFMSFSAAIVQ